MVTHHIGSGGSSTRGVGRIYPPTSHAVGTGLASRMHHGLPSLYSNDFDESDALYCQGTRPE